MQQDDEIWSRVDLLANLATAELSAGMSMHETITRLTECARAVNLSDACFIDGGRTVLIQVVQPSGRTHTRASTPAESGGIDCEQLRRLDLVTTRLSAGDLGIEQARRAIAEATTATRPWWWGPAGMALLAYCIGLQIGVGPVTALLAVVVQIAVSLTGLLAGRLTLPRLFSVTTQCLVGGGVAAAAHALSLVTTTSAIACLAVTWVLLVPLPLIVSAVVDAVNAKEVAATSRASLIVLTVGGLVLGGAIVVLTGKELTAPTGDVTLPAMPIPLILLFSALGAIANAIANLGAGRLLPTAGVIGLLTATCNLLLNRGAGLPGGWAAALTAVALGFGAAWWSRRTDHAASVLALMGITGALLPGLTVYHGVVLEIFGQPSAQYYLSAGLTCIGLGVGTTLGFVAARHRFTRTRSAAQGENEITGIS